jgi:polyhydroxyalkanoate synthesis regulator phasin
MPSNERIRKYLDAGSTIGRVQRGRAEEIVRELVSAGDIRRDQAQDWVDAMVDRSRDSSEQLLETVRKEVATQLKKIDTSSLERIAEQVAEILTRTAEAGRTATKSVSTRAEKAATDVRKQAGKTATDVRKQAGKAATDVRTQAEKTAKQARAAAKKGTAKKSSSKNAAS